MAASDGACRMPQVFWPPLLGIAEALVAKGMAALGCLRQHMHHVTRLHLHNPYMHDPDSEKSTAVLRTSLLAIQTECSISEQPHCRQYCASLVT